MKRSLIALSLAVAACGGGALPPEQPPPVPPAPLLDVGADGAGAVDRSKLPEPSARPAWVLPTPQKRALANGIPLYFLRQGSTPLVTLLLVLPRGSATDPKGKAGLTYLTTDLLDEGAGGKNALELSEALQRLGTDYGGTADVDHVALHMDLLAENFEPSAALLADIVRRPSLSAKEFQRRKDQALADALTDEAEPAHTRAVVMRRALFGDGYASTLPEGTHDTIKALALGDVKAQYAALFQPEGAAFVVVGGIDEPSASAALEKYFGDWKGEAKTKELPPGESSMEAAIHFVHHPGATQSAIALATRATGEDSDEYFPALIFNRAFGGAFTSRVNMNLREDKGYTYGARSVFSRFPHTGFFAIAASVKAETTRASIDEVLKEMHDVCSTRPITQKERDEAVGGLLLGYPGRFESNARVAQELAELPLYQRPLEWLSLYPKRVDEVTPQSANGLGKKYCDPKQFAIVVSGDEKTVVPTLEGLSRTVLRYDARGKRLK
ncbi:MAG: pitrilysin family protein [Polyangiaceae bacterium]